MADSDSREQATENSQLTDPTHSPNPAQGNEAAAAGVTTGIADFTDPLGVTTGLVHGSAPSARAELGETNHDQGSEPSSFPIP